MGHISFYIIHIVIGVHLMHQSVLEMFLLSISHISPLAIIIFFGSIYAPFTPGGDCRGTG